jgi:hypothetical protein
MALPRSIHTRILDEHIMIPGRRQRITGHIAVTRDTAWVLFPVQIPGMLKMIS